MGSAASGAEGRYSRPTRVTVWLFAVGHNRVDFKHLQTLTAVARPRAFPSFVARTDRLGCLRYANRVGAELANAEPDRGFAGDAAPRAERTATQTAPKPVPTTQPAVSTEAVSTPPGSATMVVPTPLNGNLVATSASLLGLPVHEMPASVNVVTQQQMREQGYRTTTETAFGAVGVLAADLGGAPAIFSMRGFKGNEVTVLYNGIWIGPGDITSRIMETASLEQVEF